MEISMVSGVGPCLICALPVAMASRSSSLLKPSTASSTSEPCSVITLATSDSAISRADSAAAMASAPSKTASSPPDPRLLPPTTDARRRPSTAAPGSKLGSAAFAATTPTSPLRTSMLLRTSGFRHWDSCSGCFLRRCRLSECRSFRQSPQ
uniref:Putative secreted protein n=1 Tax=Ixodes ricinus TaxID=34613 RepID=A0A6B0UWT6_IXORI